MANTGTTRHSGKHQFTGFVSNRYTEKDLTGAKTLGNNDAGAYTISGSAAITVTLPAVSKVCGSELILRSLSAHAHLLTGSADDAGALVFSVTGSQSDLADANGSQMALPALVGSSVVLKSDGVNWLVLAHSGSLRVSNA